MKSRPQPFHDLPLQLAGLSAAVEESLCLAGVPVSPFTAEKSILGRVRERPGRFVLFDSRSTASRVAAQVAAKGGRITIDVAALGAEWDGRGAGKTSNFPPDRRRRAKSKFLGRLKQHLERAGGIWMRVADYPFPYQCALCGDFDPAGGKLARFGTAFATIHESDNSDHKSDNSEHNSRDPKHDETIRLIQQKYSAGLPMSLRMGADSDTETVVARLDCVDFPLLWNTSHEEFARWWRVRRNVTVGAQRQDAVYCINSDFDREDFRPALELWRGRHVASFPLSPGRTSVREAGLAFLRDEHKHPAGFLAGWIDELDPSRSTSTKLWRVA